MSSSLRTRAAAWSLLPIAAVALWLLFGPGRGLAETDEADLDAEGAGSLAAAQLPAGARSDAEASDLSRSRVDALVGLDGDGGADGADAPVHLRVLLRVFDDEGEERIPPDCAGWTVRAQSWISETGEVFAHEARADARGVAEFTFTGFTHVDWAGCSPPESSGLGFSQMSEHIDFDAGSSEEWTLYLQPGGAAHGRVLTMDDRPVAGAEVHAFDPSWSGDFETWTPGFLTARTGADGGFRFPSLGEGDWIFAVAPGERLQVVPALGDAQDGQGHAQVEAGADADAGVLRVVVATAHEVRVVDADGGGVAGLTFAIYALSFSSPALRATQEFVPTEEEEDPTESWTQRFLAGEDPGAWLDAEPEASDAEPGEDEDALDWPYDGVARDTDAEGRVSWQLPPGSYRIECWSSVPGMPGGTIPTFDVVVPGPPTLFRLAVSRAPWSGRVVDDLGAPVESASLVLAWRNEDGTMTWEDEASTDAAGAFRFEDVPLLRDCVLTITSGWHVPTSWRVSLQEQPSAPFCLPRGARMRVIATGPDGAVVDLAAAQSRVVPLRFEVPPAPPGTLAGETRRQEVAGALYCIQNQLISDQLPAGEYELRLHLSSHGPAFFVNAWGFTQAPLQMFRAAESVLIGAWPVRTGDEPNRITLDAEQVALLVPTAERHAGVVLDAETGAPVSGALVTALGRSTVGVRTGADGRFELETDSTLEAFEVEAQGYERLHLDAADGDGEHEFRMRHAGAMVHLRVLDRDGRRLPPCTVDVLFPGAAGGFPPETPEQGHAGMGLPEGEIYFHSRTPGRHRVRVNFAPGVHAEAVFDLSQTRDYAPVDVRIGMSLAELRAALLAAPR